MSEGTVVLGTRQARQAERVGLIRILSSSLILAAVLGLGLLSYH